MQHLDEGTIHAWLDGALPADEAASVERHAAGCAACAALVAEARGLLAASSRILGAVDAGAADAAPAAAPPVAATAGPAAAPRRERRGGIYQRRNQLVAAAAVALLAVGVVRVSRVSVWQGEPEAAEALIATSAAAADTAAMPAPTAVAEAAPLAGSAAAGARAVAPPPPAPAPAPAVQERSNSTVGSRAPAAAREARSAAAAGAAGGSAKVAAAPPAVPAAPTPAAPAADASRELRAEVGATVAAAGPASPTLRGRVTDAAGRPIAGAQVVAQGRDSAAVTTDTLGRYAIDSLSPGRYAVAARRIGYESRRDTVEVAPGADPRVDLALAPAALQLDAVAVAPERAEPAGARTRASGRVPARAARGAAAPWARCYTLTARAWTPTAPSGVALPVRLTLDTAGAGTLDGAAAFAAAGDAGTSAALRGRWRPAGAVARVELPTAGGTLRFDLTAPEGASGDAPVLDGTARFVRGEERASRPVSARAGCGAR